MQKVAVIGKNGQRELTRSLESIRSTMTEARHVLLVTHTRRDEAVSATKEAFAFLLASGITPVVTVQEHGELVEAGLDMSEVLPLGQKVQIEQLELAMVLGGDGTILRAAELVRESQTPLLGVNLGHVGFLAESERAELVDTVRAVANRDYLVKERLTLDVSVIRGGKCQFESWALNEATVERAAAGRMLEVVVEIDKRPLSSFGCDGIVMSTPTGSTAHAFSAGGPVVWPSVEALLLVPLSAHALFSRPLVIEPTSLLAIEVLQRSTGHGVLWCDGRRTFDLLSGDRIEVKRSEKSVRLARISQAPFTDRIVRKFALPVSGWRGPDGAAS